MPGHHFISYSTADARDFALRLCDALSGHGLVPWLDQRQLKPGRDWDEQLVEALRDCDSLVFVMSHDSVEEQSVCKNEWARALRYKKPVTPVLVHREAVVPFRLESRQYLDFTGDFEPALDRLCEHLHWLASPPGMLQVMKDRLADARRDLRRAPEVERRRVEDEIALLQKQIAEQQRVAEDPGAADALVRQRIESGLERERRPVRADELGAAEGAGARSRFINPPPGAAPGYFQDRAPETKLLGETIRDDSLRLIWLAGRGGIGKTALACRLLKALEGGRLPDDGSPLPVRGIVYLSAAGSRRVNAANFYADLCRLLPPDAAQALEVLYRKPQVSTREKVLALLEKFPVGPEGPAVVLLDNFEDLVDEQTLGLADAEIDEALRAVLEGPHHAVTVLVTTRVVPRPLLLMQPGRQRQVLLDEGLPPPFAQNILREMDADGKLGLRDAPDEVLEVARVRTGGYPRALEAMYAILAADRGTTLREVLDGAAGELPENVTEALVGRAFSRLDPVAQRVMEALAVYGTPVTAAAVDYLLQPHVPGIDSKAVLGRLAHMQFAHREGGRYFLHPVDRAYALRRVPKGEPADRGQGDPLPFSRLALLHRGAEYFRKARLPQEEWKRIDDLSPQLAQLELLYAAEDYDAAAEVLLEIDSNYLLKWGFYRLAAELHERLQGKVPRPALREQSVGNLGVAYQHMGKMRQAIACHEQALSLARQTKDRRREAADLGNLGACYSDVGEAAKAIEHHEQALAISREIGDRRSEGIRLENLGNCYVELGQTTRAIEFYQRGLAISRETGDRRGEGVALGNLGSCYATSGQTAKAIEYHELGLAISREIGDRRGEAADLGNLGNRYAELGRPDKAIEYHERALAIRRGIGSRWGEGVTLANLADVYLETERYEQALTCANEVRELARETHSPVLASYGAYYAALAALFGGDLPRARESAEEARRSDAARNNHNVCALLGLVALRQGDAAAAREAFAAAVAQADALLEHTPQNFEANDTRGFALSGLAVCGGVEQCGTALVSSALAAFQAARAVNRDAGMVSRVVRLFDALAAADAAGALTVVRAAAAGEG